ncbi:hypothetical protein V5P93_002882 [Actinokineospora auranticolor]|uniref:Mce-associated membrane protein n=1 Tax=Actinokineospora auranticolor TaxID=155976 RepID=A0A2S6H0L6_9PSEU|nr:hypothetical protein [Actinokineospora auranticolor]PPK71024.1 hypothetical protein CLV40_101210 [Actinokineospora auranticolor]
MTHPPQPPTPPIDGDPRYPGATPPPRRRSALRVLLIAAVALVLVVGAGVGVYYLSRDRGAPPEPERASGPETVRDMYMGAYEAKHFDDVLAEACEAYRTRFGTTAEELERGLADYDVTARADGEPKVDGEKATARIALVLDQGGRTKNAHIEIKMVKEDGRWRFCGEQPR